MCMEMWGVYSTDSRLRDAAVTVATRWVAASLLLVETAELWRGALGFWTAESGER